VELVSLQLNDYLSLVASDAPAPGGGSASALCGAQGIGLIAMVAKLTLSKSRFIEYHPVCRLVAAEAGHIMEKMARQIDADTEAYSQLAKAFRLPKITEEDRAVRIRAIGQATEYAAEVPLETMRLGVQGLECASRLIGNFNLNCASDVGCGVAGLLSCVRGAYMNVKINVGGVPDTIRADYFRQENEHLLSYAEALAGSLTEKILGCI